MCEAYGAIVAAHYAAFRPALHEGILARALPGDRRWRVGLDLGCGTGRSAVALAHFCDHVFAVDPSQAMLQAATKHESVRYLSGSSDQVDLADHSIDIVTFAGSLFYTDRVRAAQELLRLCRNDSWIVVYDFDLQLEPWLNMLGLITSVEDSSKVSTDRRLASDNDQPVAYDHEVNFAGFSALKQLSVNQLTERIQLTATQLAHVLLSDPGRLRMLADRFGEADPLEPLSGELGRWSESWSGQPALCVEAKLYWSVYQPNP